MLDLFPSTNVFRCFQVKSARKNGKPLKQAPLHVRQQTIAPIDGRPQRLMSWQRRPLSVREQVKAVLQTIGNLRSAQRAHACGRQLNGQRNAFHPPTDSRHGRSDCAR